MAPALPVSSLAQARSKFTVRSGKQRGMGERTLAWEEESPSQQLWDPERAGQVPSVLGLHVLCWGGQLSEARGGCVLSHRRRRCPAPPPPPTPAGRWNHTQHASLLTLYSVILRNLLSPKELGGIVLL